MKYPLPALIVLALTGTALSSQTHPFPSQAATITTRSVSLANFKLIRHGMSVEHVDKLMGQRGGTFLAWTGVAFYRYKSSSRYVDIKVDGIGVLEGLFISAKGHQTILAPTGNAGN